MGKPKQKSKKKIAIVEGFEYEDQQSFMSKKLNILITIIALGISLISVIFAHMLINGTITQTNLGKFLLEKSMESKEETTYVTEEFHTEIGNKILVTKPVSASWWKRYLLGLDEAQATRKFVLFFQMSEDSSAMKYINQGYIEYVQNLDPDYKPVVVDLPDFKVSNSEKEGNYGSLFEMIMDKIGISEYIESTSLVFGHELGCFLLHQTAMYKLKSVLAIDPMRCRFSNGDLQVIKTRHVDWITNSEMEDQNWAFQREIAKAKNVQYLDVINELTPETKRKKNWPFFKSSKEYFKKLLESNLLGKTLETTNDGNVKGDSIELVPVTNVV